MYLPPFFLAFRILIFRQHNVALGPFIAALAAATAAPIILETRRMALVTRVTPVFLFVLLTGLSIAALDRASIQGLLQIVFFGFAVTVLGKRWGWSVILVGIAPHIEIYRLVLVLLLLALREYKTFAVALGLAAGALLEALPMISTAGPGGLPIMIGGALQFQDRTIEKLLKYNITLVASLANLAAFLGTSNIGIWLASHACVLLGIYVICVTPLLWIHSIEIRMWVSLVTSLTTSLMPIIYSNALNWLLATPGQGVRVSQGLIGHVEQPRLVSPALMLALAGARAVLPILIPGAMEAERPTGIVGLRLSSLLCSFLVSRHSVGGC